MELIQQFLEEMDLLELVFQYQLIDAKLVIDQLIEFGETKRGWLGVRIQDVTQEIADVEKLR